MYAVGWEGEFVRKRPKLELLDKYFNKDSFELTDSRYEKLTGCPLPKDKSYLKNKSALSKKCKELGFVIVEVQEKKVLIKKKQ